ncbi:hypothetical protein [Salibacterium aidingense]|uniref:hypothetical protein n=1 Tax=Salibacterium aidingense TaxID=384933 RepID=UPI0012EBC679|nr:hypothetical protein [Salibacterium aidingense]
MIFFIYILENLAEEVIVAWNTYRASALFPGLLVITIPIACVYFLVLFEVKKPKHLFQRKMWKQMPFIIAILGAASLAAVRTDFLGRSMVPVTPRKML